MFCSTSVNPLSFSGVVGLTTEIFGRGRRPRRFTTLTGQYVTDVQYVTLNLVSSVRGDGLEYHVTYRPSSTA